MDSAYQHVPCRHEVLEYMGIRLSVWRIHRRIGMSGGLVINMLLREAALDLDPDRIEQANFVRTLSETHRAGPTSARRA